MTDRTVRIGNREVALSRPDKVLFPADGITKADLFDYYRRIAEVALPHYRDRPLTMERYPDGIDEDGFIQKDTPDHFPDWIERAELGKEGGSVRYVLANEAATLAYLADQGVVTPHLGLSRVDKVDQPDRLIFDLDPSDNDFSKVQFAAKCVRGILDELGFPSFVQTTGSRGLHVVVALDRSADFDAVRGFAQRLAAELAGRHPKALTVERLKKDRGDRVFLDVARNAYGQTAAGPYGVRARPGAPVATPLDWDEALDGAMEPQRYTIGNIFRRLGAKTDPWAAMDDAAVPARTLKAALDEIRR